jgi:uncharacterized damage-inducible protein DinB
MTKPVVFTSEILALYADGPARLESALTGLPESDLDLALAADSWSIRQIVHHLADGDDIWKTCIKAALGNSEGLLTLQWYWDKSQMEWSENWKYASRGIKSSLALMRANRLHILELLEQTPSALEKSIRLQRPQNQEDRITVCEVLEIHIRHMVDHIKDIQAIRQAHGV